MCLLRQNRCDGCETCCRPPAILSKDDIEAEKQRFKAIDARPIKKVAEAKARKKKRLQVNSLPHNTRVLT